MFRCRRVIAALLGLGLCAGAAGARADIWWYIDAEGKSHVATEKVDDRYELFYKDPADGAPTANDAAAKPASDPALDALRETSFYKRIAEHPNLERFRNLIDQYAQASGLDAALVKAVIAVESAFNPAAVSAKGALGLMQVIPETGERYGLAADKRHSVQQKLLDPETNLRIGTTYLRDLMALFANDITLVLAAYNVGPGNVEDLHGTPDDGSDDTLSIPNQSYVDAVHKNLQSSCPCQS